VKTSGWDRLPEEQRAWLIAQWRRSGWGEHERIAAGLAARLSADPEALAAVGGSPPSVRTVTRWAAEDRRERARVRMLAEMRAATAEVVRETHPEAADPVGAYLEDRLVDALEEIDRAAADLDPLARLAALTGVQRATTERRRAEIAARQADLARERFEAARPAAAHVAERLTAEGGPVTAERVLALMSEAYGLPG
jgi:hypothetical protein